MMPCMAQVLYNRLTQLWTETVSQNIALLSQAAPVSYSWDIRLGREAWKEANEQKPWKCLLTCPWAFGFPHL